MCEVVCEYKNRCSSSPDWCQTCQRNRGRRNFYVPIPYPYPVWYENGSWYIAETQVTNP